MIPSEHWFPEAFRWEVAHHAEVATQALPVLFQFVVGLDIVYVKLTEVTTVKYVR